MANPKQSDFPYGWTPATMKVARACSLSMRLAAARTRKNPESKFDFIGGPFRKGDVNSATLLLTPRLSRVATIPRGQYSGNVKEVPNAGRK